VHNELSRRLLRCNKTSQAYSAAPGAKFINCLSKFVMTQRAPCAHGFACPIKALLHKAGKTGPAR
jgi:hypothetical protein